MFLSLIPRWSLWVFVIPDSIIIKPCISLLRLTVYERLWTNNEVLRSHVNNQECFNNVTLEIAPLNSFTKKDVIKFWSNMFDFMVIFKFLRTVIGIVILLWSGVVYVYIYLPAYLKWIKENSTETLTYICQSMWQYIVLPLCLFEASWNSSINYSNCRICQDVSLIWGKPCFWVTFARE